MDVQPTCPKILIVFIKLRVLKLEIESLNSKAMIRQFTNPAREGN
jgi:hypothetical protein